MVAVSSAKTHWFLIFAFTENYKSEFKLYTYVMLFKYSNCTSDFSLNAQFN